MSLIVRLKSLLTITNTNGITINGNGSAQLLIDSQPVELVSGNVKASELANLGPTPPTTPEVAADAAWGDRQQPIDVLQHP